MIIHSKLQLILKSTHKNSLYFKLKNHFCSNPSQEEQVKALKEKVRLNCIFDSEKKNEKEYNDQIDEAFRVYPIVLQLQKNEENTLKEQYLGLLDFITTKKARKTFDQEVNAQLVSYLQQNLFKNQIENFLKIERMSLAQQGNASQQQFHFLHRGHLQVFGVRMDRSQNEFIHKYTYQKNQAELRFTRRITSQEKLDQLDIKDILPEELQGKTTKMKKQIEDIMSKETKELDQNAPKTLKGTILDVAKKFGYDFKDNKIDGAEYFNKISSYKKKAFESLHKSEEYILVEDFMLRTTESIRIKALSGEVLWEDIPKEDGLFHHYIRTEALCDLNEAPSLKNNRKRIITDIDGKLFGNPPCLVKRFDLATK
ncbi:hypothetical protein TTHERM_00773170 (macronuclear) [Tetrahymena thermophila SB210]|uniref:Uncharacterized protein n=1 Tax=Tetrahymena thermophila (strain SB210) TaxID=312017 RepID=I7LZG8_TETTS|nr:hypothetical protein TTHERM_00773170 [Tetrahymena thermophila SB210]EAR83907.1 hypothetical protein TTHERM_00773170 [Tetrahymena thermophila SB210]|eukprot:XP_001031570.1 hypothetical protein TTHERM_00773170 [Tetrahymena thermophila SB210]